MRCCQGTSAPNAYGGSAYHAEGSGKTTATNAYGGSAKHYAGGGTVATNSSGQTAYGNVHCGAYGTAYHPPTAYYGYHPPATANVTYQMGSVYGALPAGCISPNGGGSTYYLCGNIWFSPSYGANGVIYRVVPAP